MESQKKLGGTPKAILSTVGFSGHGKTVFLASLLHELDTTLPSLWPNYYRLALNQEAVNTLKQNLSILTRGDLPESTRRNFPAPSIHQLNNIAQIGNRVLIAYDPPGEAFESDELIESYAHFVRGSPTVIFIISLKDLAEPRGEEAYRLLNNYLLGMARLGAKTRNQHLIVTFTKADQLLAELERYPLVLQHLATPAENQVRRPKDYLKQLKLVSAELEKFTLQDLRAQNFINLVRARNNFKSYQFCAVSALGSAPENGHLASNFQPKRVVDPLIWVLDKAG